MVLEGGTEEMPLIIESNDLFSRLKMIESLRRFSVTKLLSSPALLSLLSSLFPFRPWRGKKREQVLQILSPPPPTGGRGDERRRAVNGVTRSPVARS